MVKQNTITYILNIIIYYWWYCQPIFLCCTFDIFNFDWNKLWLWKLILSVWYQICWRPFCQKTWWFTISKLFPYSIYLIWIVFYLHLNVLSEAFSCIILVVRASKNEEYEASQLHHLIRWIVGEGGWKVTCHQYISRRSLSKTWIICPNKSVFSILGHFYK